MAKTRFNPNLMIGRKPPPSPSVKVQQIGSTNPGMDLVKKIRFGR